MPDRPDRIDPAPPRGMRDVLPDRLRPRLKVIELMRRRFELYGFQPLETPALERLDVLAGKSGEEADKLTFRVMKRGADLKRALRRVAAGQALPDELADLGLRFEFTVSLARVVAQYGDRLPRPFKRYQIGPVWRADRPQHGRYREFIQCDVDIVGTDAPLADAELIALTVELLSELRLPPFEVRVNHRGLLAAISLACGNPPQRFFDFCAALDKLERVGREGVAAEMRERGLETGRLERLWELSAGHIDAHNGAELKAALERMNDLVAGNAAGQQAVQQLDAILGLAVNLGVPPGSVVFDPSLARGLDYYTGPVFEAVAREADIGSLGGGGRYDELVGLFAGEPVPATGIAFGLERIIDVMLEQGLLVPEKVAADVNILLLEGSPDEVLFGGAVARFLRRSSLPCEVDYDAGARLGRRIQAAVRRGSRLVVFVGPDELKGVDLRALKAEGGDYPLSGIQVTAKRLAEGEQRRLTLSQLLDWAG